jgi:hypothetical protein
MRAGIDLYDLRQLRNVADYDLHRTALSRSPTDMLASRNKSFAPWTPRAEPTRSQIIAAMRVYERDVLGDVIWTGP